MKPTVEQLKKSWWWRQVGSGELFWPKSINGQTVSSFPTWKGGVEYAAFQWEMVRRHDEAPKLPPFPDLPELIAFELVMRFGKSQYPWIETTTLDPSAHLKFEPGYSAPSIWPLRLPNNTLEKRFRAFIAEQRTAQNITRRKGRELSKGPAWRNVELLDLAKHGVRGKSPLAHGRDFDSRRYFEARTRCNAAWRDLKASGALQHYLGT